MPTDGIWIEPCINRQHIFQQVGRDPEGHKGSLFRLKPEQLRGDMVGQEFG
jgi:hypothetical protein